MPIIIKGIHVETQRPIYVWRGDYHEKDVAKTAGFRWDPINKVWWTYDINKVVPIKKWADLAVMGDVEKFLDSFDASSQVSVDVNYPCPEGQDYLPFQKAGIKYALDRPSTFFGDEMGLGKTIQAIGFMNVKKPKTVLVICPASLKENWFNELAKWLIEPYNIVIQKSNKPFKTQKQKTLDDIENLVLIVNYDIVKKFHDQIYSQTWDLLICDECHMLKNPKAQRTQSIVGKDSTKQEKEAGIEDIPGISATNKLFLSGTPMLNRPIELWSIIHYLDKAIWNNFWYFAKRYCNAGNNGWGWDFKGANRETLPELQNKLRGSIMVRRLKADVLTELPDKTRQLIPLESKELREYEDQFAAGMREKFDNYVMLKAKLEACKDAEIDYSDIVQQLKAAGTDLFEEMSKMRHEIGKLKVPLIIEAITDAINEEHKIVVFAWHHDVVHAIEAAFPGQCVAITGETPVDKRQGLVEQFQKDPNTLVIVGTIKAMGVGFTLTASSHCIFAEFDWVPGNLNQAEDRLHRIGQKDNVLIQHYVLNNSLESHIVKTVMDKQAIANLVLDDDTGLISNMITELPPKPAIRPRLEVVDPAEVIFIHQQIRSLTAVCDGACERDKVGFNKYDTNYMRTLAMLPELRPTTAAYARNILLKYHRQLGDQVTDHLKSIVVKGGV